MRLSIVTFLLLVLLCTSVVAADLFTVDGIKASSNGATAKQAKDTAMLTGQREAFAKLLERITSTPANSTLLNMEADKLAELVQGIEVNDEKITASYYSATLNISFNKSFIEKLLQENGISFTDKKSAPIVLIPLLIRNGENMLFEEENPLRKSLAATTSTNPVLTIIVPANLRGVDKSKLNQNIEDLIPEVKNSLLKIGQNYKADKLILIAALQIDGDNVNIRLQDIKDPESSIKEISFKARDANVGEDIFAYAARSITSLLESQWIKGKASDNVSRTKITLTIPIKSLDEWASMRKKLEGLSFLKEVTIKSLTVKSALVDVVFNETFENLIVKMDENGLGLERNKDAIIVHMKGANISNSTQSTSNVSGAI